MRETSERRMKLHLPEVSSSSARCSAAEALWGSAIRPPLPVFFADLAQRLNRRRVDDAVGHKVPGVLLPSSNPHHEVSVQGLGGGVVVIAMALSSCCGVLGELVVDDRAGVLLWPERRAVHGGGRFRFADVSKRVPRELVDLLPTMRRRLRTNTNMVTSSDN